MGAQQPFMYSAVHHYDERFPQSTFDPKAVTRASWEPKKPKPKPDGPLVSFNRHPDAHMVLAHRSNNYATMSPGTKGWIKWLRIVQLSLRVLELIGALELLALNILIANVEPVTRWILRITAGIFAICCLYSIYHHARSAGDRAPASSAAYQLFSGVSDVVTASFYTFGAFAEHKWGDSWTTLLKNESLVDYFLPAVYYSYISLAALHLVSFSIACWLGWMFHTISLMPPDMNPLEDHLTARPKHKRNKSSIMTESTVEDDRRLSRQSTLPPGSFERPRSIPFMHTRTNSRTSIGNASTVTGNSSQYHQVPRGPSRHSANPSEGSFYSAAQSFHRPSFSEISLDEPGSMRPASGSGATSPIRAPKFTETWIPTDSLISRTKQRQREMAAAKTTADNRGSKSYETLSQRYCADEDSEPEEYNENDSQGLYDAPGLQPHPLRLNPTASLPPPPRKKTPFYPLDNPLGEISSNARRVSASGDITDQKPALAPSTTPLGQRQSSIQPESAFYSKPYGDLKSSTPPFMVGADRKVSSGNDFGAVGNSTLFERRNVSGKVAEEGRSGPSQRGFPLRSTKDKWESWW